MHNLLYADIACTDLFLRASDADGLVMSPAEKSVTLPDGSTINSNLSSVVSIGVSGSKMTAAIFDDSLLGHSLLFGLAPLVNQGCVVTFNEDSVTITKDGKNILSGKKAKDDHLWNVNVPLYSAKNIHSGSC